MLRVPSPLTRLAKQHVIEDCSVLCGGNDSGGSPAQGPMPFASRTFVYPNIIGLMGGILSP